VFHDAMNLGLILFLGIQFNTDFFSFEPVRVWGANQHPLSGWQLAGDLPRFLSVAWPDLIVIGLPAQLQKCGCCPGCRPFALPASVSALFDAAGICVCGTAAICCWPDQKATPETPTTGGVERILVPGLTSAEWCLMARGWHVAARSFLLFWYDFC